MVVAGEAARLARHGASSPPVSLVKLATAALLLLLSLLQLGKLKLKPRSEPSAEDNVLSWVVFHGGQINFEVQRKCPHCVRSAYATHDIQKGGLIALVPLKLAVYLQEQGYSEYDANQEWNPACAYELLSKMHLDPSFNQTYGPWWASQPPQGSVLSAELFTEGHLALLQSSWLVEDAKRARSLAEAYYLGTKGPKGRPLAEVVGPGRLSLDTFLHVSGLISSRAFDLNPHTKATVLVPAVDMVNQSLEPNSERDWDAKTFVVKALRHIRPGEEITQMYSDGQTHRPDVTLALYGFVQRHEPPLLCSEDLPGFTPERALHETPDTDEMLDPPTVGAMQQEAERLQRVLDGLPTTQEQDEKLLQAERDWKRRAILELRVERKRALWYRIGYLQRRAQGAGGAGGQPGVAAVISTGGAAAVAQMG